MAYRIQMLIHHIAQLLRQMFLDHLKMSVPLMCVSSKAGPLSEFPLPNDGLGLRLEDRINAWHRAHWGVLFGKYASCFFYGGSLLTHSPLLGRGRGFDEGLAVCGGEACGQQDKSVVRGRHGNRVLCHGTNMPPTPPRDENAIQGRCVPRLH